MKEQPAQEIFDTFFNFQTKLLEAWSNTTDIANASYSWSNASQRYMDAYEEMTYHALKIQEEWMEIAIQSLSNNDSPEMVKQFLDQTDSMLKGFSTVQRESCKNWFRLLKTYNPFASQFATPWNSAPQDFMDVWNKAAIAAMTNPLQFFSTLSPAGTVNEIKEKATTSIKKPKAPRTTAEIRAAGAA